MAVGPETAAKWNQPPIPLIDPETGEKIKLCLRRMSFAREIATLPVDMLKVHEIIIKQRATRNESVYMMVAAWKKLHVYHKYWTSFKFASEEEYLAYYGLPDGMTLAGWTVMVNLFDKATFVLLGDEVLSFMMRVVGEYQNDTDERKKDYQGIFDNYCSGRDSFDKAAFYRTAQHYVSKKYEEPLAKKEGVTREVWRKKKLVHSIGVRRRREITEAPEKQTYGPRVEHDFSWKREQCPHCREKLEVVKAYQKYVAQLERTIVEKLGKQHLPKRPEELKKI